MKTIPAKSILQKNKSGAWFGNDYNMNLYKGCCHGCIYCDSRSGCYNIDNFDEVRAKENALEILRDELKRRTPGIIGTGSMSDPYNPFEKTEQLSRRAAELIRGSGFGLTVVTKSPLITRDIDVFGEIAAEQPLLLKMTITTADDGFCRLLEPNVLRHLKGLLRLDFLRGLRLCRSCRSSMIPPRISAALFDGRENVEFARFFLFSDLLSATVSANIFTAAFHGFFPKNRLRRCIPSGSAALTSAFRRE